MNPLFTSPFAVLLVGASLTLAAPAAATPRSPEARREAYLLARDAIVEKKWDVAEHVLEELWLEDRTYDVALGLGQAELNLEKYANAAEHLTFALDHLPPREKPELRQRATELLGVAKEQVGWVKISVRQSGSVVRVDGREVGTAPLPADVFLAPGPHVLEASFGVSASRKVTVDVLAGQAYVVTLFVEPAVAPAPGATKPPAASSPTNDPPPRAAARGGPWWRSAGPYVAAGIGVAGLGAGAYLLARAGSDESDKRAILERIPEQPACGRNTPYVAWCARVRELDRSARRSRTAGFLGIGVGALGAAGAVALFLLPNDGQGESAHAVTLSPVIGAGNVGISAARKF